MEIPIYILTIVNGVVLPLVAWLIQRSISLENKITALETLNPIRAKDLEKLETKIDQIFELLRTKSQ